MAKRPDLQIQSYLNSNSQPEPQPEDYETVKIQMISVYDIIPNPENKYDINAIDELADRIEATDDITPLDVKPVDNGKYMMISGHRRQQAIFLLLNQNRRESDKVPCIVKTYADIEEERAAIVFKNSQREKTDREREMEMEMSRPFVERKYKEERAKAKAEGRDFMKFRKYFADKLGVSETTIHREEAYQKVAEEIKKDVQAGKTTKTAVAEIASLPKGQQKKVYNAAKDETGRVSVKAIQEQKENLKKLEQEEQTTIFGCKVEVTNKSGSYKPEYVKQINIGIPTEYGKLIIYVAHDPNDQKYRVGYQYIYPASGGINITPTPGGRPYQTEQQAAENMIEKLLTIGSDSLKQGLKATGYAKIKPKTIVANVQIASKPIEDEAPEQADEWADSEQPTEPTYKKTAIRNFIDELQEEIEKIAEDIQKTECNDIKEDLRGDLTYLAHHLEIAQEDLKRAGQ